MNGLCDRRTAGLLVIVLVAGCGVETDRPQIAEVTGTVTMDGNPLPKVRVMFGPTEGRPSTGITDDEGRYELLYTFDTPGAKIGQHIVSIVTYYEDEDSPEALSAKETIPARYNSKTELKAEVKADEDNVIDFPLESKK